MDCMPDTSYMRTQPSAESVTATSAPGGRPRSKPAPDTPFKAWLRTGHMTVREVAEALGLTRWAIYNLRSQHHKPSLEVANQIASLSDGAVPADSWGVTNRKASRAKVARAKRRSKS